MNRQLLEHLAREMGVDPTIPSDGDLLADLCSASVGSDLVERLIESASEFVDDPRYARIRVSEYDVIYGVLDEVRDKVRSEGVSQAEINAEVDTLLAAFTDPAGLWKFGASCIDNNASSKTDDDHDWWGAEEPDTEQYVEQRVREMLGL